jgi:hypothetical protein
MNFPLGLAGLVLVLSLALATVTARHVPVPRRGRHRAPAPRPAVTTEFRYCPEELRTRAVVVHRDGTSRCDCGADIPAGTQ